ncbi:hypothetical protein OC834_001409 [Tilletia horrida]|nr:hypothetical protein OC834_001409 [Tilletia horrida]
MSSPSRYASASGHDALLGSVTGSSRDANLSKRAYLAPVSSSSSNTQPLYSANDGNLSDVDLAPPPPLHDGLPQSNTMSSSSSSGGGGGNRLRNMHSSSSNNNLSSRFVSRPGSRTSMLSTADTFRTASPAFDRRPSITPQLAARSGAASPLILDEPPHPSSRLGAASPSLAVNYLPGKFSTRVFQPDRSQSPAHGGGIFASRSASRLRVPPTLSDGLLQQSGSSTELTLDEENKRQGAVTPLSTAVRRAAAQNPAQAPRLRHSIKRGAGRSAWGPDGGGNAVVGAGDYEDDDGIDLSRSASTRRRLQQRRQAAADGINEAGFQPGEADRRRTSLLQSNLGHFTEIGDTDEEDQEDGGKDGSGNGDGSTGTSGEQAGVKRQKNRRQRSLRRDADKSRRSGKSSSRSSGSEPLFGAFAGSRLAYVLGFHDGDDEMDDHHAEDDHFADVARLQGSRFASSRMTNGKKKKRRAKWNPFKWAMVVANLVLTIYAIAGLIGTLFTWANVWENAATVRVGNRDELILSTVAAGLCLVSAVIGWSGILLNNRTFLAIYTVFLWIAFVFIMAPGYMTFKRRAFNLEGKLNQQWSRRLGVADRLVIQDELNCCGYYSPYVLASASGRCYSRSMLPGCKGRYIRFQRQALEYFYICAFGVVGPHLIIIVIALLCSNNITYRFGKGLTPEEYRLDEVTAELIKEQLLKNPPGLPSPGEASDSDLVSPGKTFREDSYGGLSAEGKHTFDEGGSSITAHAGTDDNSDHRRKSAYAQGLHVRGIFKQPGEEEAHEMQDFGGAGENGPAGAQPASAGGDRTPAPPALNAAHRTATAQDLQVMPLLARHQHQNQAQVLSGRQPHADSVSAPQGRRDDEARLSRGGQSVVDDGVFYAQ